LLEAQVLAHRLPKEAGSILEVASTFTLGLQINTSMLASQGFDAWRASRLPHRNGAQAVRLRFVGLTPQGNPDLQSGLLLLPEGSNAPSKLDWVIYNRGSEMLRAAVPSRLANYEIDLAWLLASLGHAVWMPDYGGAGDSPGQQHYCLPESLAASAVYGLAAARTWQAQAEGKAETGRLRVMGYSEGGLATMATLKLWSEKPELASGLDLTDAYPMGAPLDLTKDYQLGLDGKLVVTHPHYTILLVLGWARAYPELIVPQNILQADILESIVPLVDGEHSDEQIHKAVAELRHKQVGSITVADIYLPEFLAHLKADPSAEPYLRLRQEASLDHFVPPGKVAVTLAASPTDQLVPPANSRASLAALEAAHLAVAPRLINLASPTHVQAGEEALFFALMDVDQKTAAP